MGRVILGLALAVCLEVGVTAPGQGISFLSLDPRTGMIGMYVQGERVVFFESVRWERPADAVVEDIAASGVEVAVRLFDAQGRNIAVLSQGQGVPDDWETGGTGSLSPAQAHEAFSQGLAAIEALTAVSLDPRFEPDRTTLIALDASLSIAQQETEDAIKALESVGVFGTSPDLAAIQASSADFQVLEIWSKCIDLLCIARHGATRTHRYIDGVLGEVINQCNHGSCPDTNGMELKQRCQGPTLADPRLLIRPVGCSAPYDALSRGGHHNSNDDTDLQNARVFASKPFSQYQGQCSDGAGSPEPRHDCWAGRADWALDNQAPLGEFHLTRSYTAHGWALDPDDLQRPVWIHFYIDGVLAGEATANPPGEGAWSWTIPPAFRIPGLHSVTAYALDYGVAVPLGMQTYTVP
jgi:hypothetical protein